VASASVSQDVPSPTDALAAAQRARIAAQDRFDRLSAELDALNAEVDQRFAGAAELAADLESARSQMRHGAITAFIQGGPDDRSIELLAGADMNDVSSRETFAANRALDWADAAARFQALKTDNDPALVALTVRREDLTARVADARDAVYQASAVEADAERASEEAVRQHAAEVAAVKAAGEAEAKRRAQEIAGTPTTRSSKPSKSSPTTSAPPAAPAPAPPGNAAVIVVLTEPSAPLPNLPEGGPSEEAWAAVRQCESGGNYRALSRSGRYRGAYQFDQQTWEAMGGLGDPAGALPMEQDARAKLLYIQRGVRAWPQCGLALI
jgi:hypothetical protein